MRKKCPDCGVKHHSKMPCEWQDLVVVVNDLKDKVKVLRREKRALNKELKELEWHNQNHD